MNNKENPKHDGTMLAGLGLAVAMAIGASLGVIFAPKKGTETQKELVEKAKELANKFKSTRKDIHESLTNIFGEVSDELEESYLELQGNVLAAVDGVKDQASLTKKQYGEIVKDTVEKFSEGKKWTDKNIQALIKDLQKDWK